MAEENHIKPERCVLIVDDDHDDLATMVEAFRTLSQDRWQIDTATGPAEALAMLKAQKIRLVVLAVNTPVLDVALLLGSLGQPQPDFKKAVLAHPATDEMRAASLAAGADLFFEKPVSPEGLKSIFIRLGELLDWKNAQGSENVLNRVGLPDLVQMECLGRNSSILELFHEQPLGRIYIDQGQIVHAVCGEISGERAFQKLLTISGGTYELLDFEAPPERTINRTWEFLLDAAMHQREQLAGRAPAGETYSATTADAGFSGQAAEMLICSAAGDVLYNWQSPAAATRVTLMQQVAQHAEKLIPDLQLGKLDRVEIQLAKGRTILQPRADRMIFVHVSSP